MVQVLSNTPTSEILDDDEFFGVQLFSHCGGPCGRPVGHRVGVGVGHGELILEWPSERVNWLRAGVAQATVPRIRTITRRSGPWSMCL